MNVEDPEAMRELDARLGRMYAALDASPGFEQRLEAHINRLRTKQTAASVEARARLERLHARECRKADREALLEASTVGLAALGSALAVWQLAPRWMGWVTHYLDQTDPLFISLAALAATGLALWAMLRRAGVEPRSLIGA